MKGVRATTALTPLAAVMSAMAALLCCLPWGLAAAMGAPEFQARLEWIAKLNADALREHHRNGLQLELIYASGAAERVREMVRHERQCCAFLNLTIHESHGSVAVTIEVPESGRGIAEIVFESFLAGGSAL